MYCYANTAGCGCELADEQMTLIPLVLRNTLEQMGGKRAWLLLPQSFESICPAMQGGEVRDMSLDVPGHPEYVPLTACRS